MNLTLTAKKALLFFLCVFTLVYSNISFALPAHKKGPKANELRLGLSTTYYLLQSRQNRAEMQDNIGLGAEWRGESQGETFGSGIEASGLVGVKKSDYRYVDIAEAYLNWKSPTSSIYVGRKVFDWNLLDKEWSVGMFQPRSRFDYLQERDNGLTGLFFTSDPKAPVQFTGMASPIFIPERGAPFDMAEGTCRTTSPGFICPNNSVIIYEVSTPVFFKVDMPPIKKIVFKPGAAAALKFGASDTQYLRVSGAYKPINYVYLGYEGKLDLSTQTVPIILHPRFPYHIVAAADGMIPTSDRSQLFASVIREKVIRDKPPTTWNTQEPYDTWLYGGGWKASVFDPSTKTNIFFSYFHRYGGNGEDRGPQATPGKPVFEGRFSFTNAFSYGLSTAIFSGWAEHFLWSTRFIVDTEHTGNILTSDFDFNVSRKLRFNLGVDILGSKDNTKADFISRYQQNDRVRGGITYVF